jgi:peptidyl-prolyl cis-trans isomerase B (cyclophilin B)
MRFTNIASAFVVGLMAAGALAQDPSPAKLWQEVEGVLPRKGQTGPINSPSAAIDWAEQVSKAEQVMVRSGQTPVEPFSMYYLANFLFESGRLDEALALFETIRSQFPAHPLVMMQVAKDQKPLVSQAIEDCAAEISWRTRHPRPPIPAPVLDPKVTATLHLTNGDVKIRFYGNVAPHHVENFLKHAAAGDYDGTKVSQIIQESVVNLGDPQTKGPPTAPNQPAPRAEAGPSQPHEFANLSHVRGAIAMNRHLMGSESSTMPFQVILKDQPYFDFTQTIFGKVVEGLEIVDAVSRMPRDQFQKPATDVVLKNITITRE